MKYSLSTLAIALALYHPCIAAETAPTAQVKSQRPTQQVLADNLTLYGTLQADPSSLYTVSLPQAGQISAIHVTAGQHVARGAALLELKTDPQAMVTAAQAASNLTFARGEQQRIRILTTARLATQSQLATATKAVSDAEAALHAVQQQGGTQGQQTLYAPVDAQVMSVSNQTGERLAAGAAVMQLGKTTGLQALIGIAPAMLSKLHAGMSVSISPVFGADSRTPALSGTLIRTEGLVNNQTGRIDLPVRLPQPLPSTLRSGLPIKAIIATATAKSWVVPRNAVLHDAEGDYIYQIKQGHAVRVAVTLVIQTNQSSAIRGEINPTMNIVTQGNYTLEDGMAVQEQVQ